MRSLQWTPENSVHFLEIDEDHQSVFQKAQDLRHAFVEEAPVERMEYCLRRLAAEVARHFAHEEGLMRAARYPATDWHLRQHETARARMSVLRTSIRGGERRTILEALEFMAAWLRDHTSVADRMLGAYLRNHSRVRVDRGTSCPAPNL